MSDKLKPCPFCGGEAERVDIPTVGSDPDLGGDPNAGGSCIQCKRCVASTALHFDRKENLYSSWNDRHLAGVAEQSGTGAPDTSVRCGAPAALSAPQADAEPRGCPTPGACSCLPADAKPVAWLQSQNGVEIVSKHRLGPAAFEYGWTEKPLYTTFPSQSAKLRKALEKARNILKGPHHQGGAALIAISDSYHVIDEALSGAGDGKESEGSDTTIPSRDNMDARFAWLEAKALDMGYLLTPEPEHPDSPHRRPSDQTQHPTPPDREAIAKALWETHSGAKRYPWSEMMPCDREQYFIYADAILAVLRGGE